MRNRQKLVVLGGGTGLSTVVGGNSRVADWPEHPFQGLKERFAQLDLIICTTDDGAATGRLRQEVPLIGIGDFRKCCLSMIRSSHLQIQLGLSGADEKCFIGAMHKLFNFRFGLGQGDRSVLENPLLLLDADELAVLPAATAEGLTSLGEWAAKTFLCSQQCLGNLLLAAAAFQYAGGATSEPPDCEALYAALDKVSALIGGSSGHIHPATHLPGQLIFRYNNGVQVCGQGKALTAKRGCPVAWVHSEYAGLPALDDRLKRCLRDADAIIFAPGSLYSSIIPVLQVPGMAEAIRANTKAVKILGANLWMQEGETDLSMCEDHHGFRVSELIEAYDRNVPGGASGLFDCVLASSLEGISGTMLRQYALEGKSPIHLDADRVQELGLSAVEAPLFKAVPSNGEKQAVQHDAELFADAIEEVLANKPALRTRRANQRFKSGHPKLISSGQPLSSFMAGIRSELAQKKLADPVLGDLLEELIWENRDVAVEHLLYFESVELVSEKAWRRSSEWDPILGFYDPGSRSLKLHTRLMHSQYLCSDLLVALGESLLGNSTQEKYFEETGVPGGRIYHMLLRPEEERHCFLSDTDLRYFLKLAGMEQDPKRPLLFSRMISVQRGWLTSGLLFGMLFAWYLDSRYGQAMEYHMAPLRWKTASLLPHQVNRQENCRALIKFFRERVFKHAAD